MEALGELTPKPEPATASADLLAALEPPPTPTLQPIEEGPGGVGEPEIGALDAYQLMDRLDEDQVVAEMAGRKSDILDKLVYRFWQDGKLICGLSKRGVDEAAREMAKANQCIRETSIEFAETDEWIDAKALVSRVIVDGEGGERVLESKFGLKRQMKFTNTRNGLRADNFVFEKAGAKALRNALRRMIPEEIVVNLIEKINALCPEQVEDVKQRGRQPKPPPPPEPTASIDMGLVKRIQIGFKECGTDEVARKAFLMKHYGVDSVLGLTNEQGEKMLTILRQLYRAGKPSKDGML